MARVVAGGLFNAIAFAVAIIRVSQVGQKRLRRRDGTTQQSNGKV